MPKRKSRSSTSSSSSSLLEAALVRLGRGAKSILHIRGLLDSKALARVEKFVTSNHVQKNIIEGKLFDDTTGDEDGEDRRSRIFWLERAAVADDEDSIIPPWLFNKLRDAAKVTQSHYGTAVTTIVHDKRGRWRPSFEPVQFTEYPPGGHYKGWHTDSDVKELDPEDRRGVSVVVLLSEPGTDFNGGAFEALINGRVAQVPLKAGDAVCFPAKHLRHRVTKVKSGLRKSLVFWVSRAGADIPSRFEKSGSEDDTDEDGDDVDSDENDGDDEKGEGEVTPEQRKNKRRRR